MIIMSNFKTGNAEEILNVNKSNEDEYRLIIVVTAIKRWNKIERNKESMIILHSRFPEERFQLSDKSFTWELTLRNSLRFKHKTILCAKEVMKIAMLPLEADKSFTSIKFEMVVIIIKRIRRIFEHSIKTLQVLPEESLLNR
ncbi:hypothetical protein HNY73_012139 [Argiope bruennichi]|uniref:Uncharacterized protein n=1 Tax=Argiope bruennichi TaxID=94029 RepID=A0A8T0EVJ7_ARGBR|nr:hypothetical protein HNY73_012139 [Argiope bruennichi]